MRWFTRRRLSALEEDAVTREAENGLRALNAARILRGQARYPVALEHAESTGLGGFIPTEAEYDELRSRLRTLTAGPTVPDRRVPNEAPYTGVTLRNPDAPLPSAAGGDVEALFPADRHRLTIEFVIHGGLISRYDWDNKTSVVRWEDPGRQFEAWLLRLFRQHNLIELLTQWRVPQL
jgi:hypothetical protein